MTYKVKNTVTGEETICEKVVVDGFNYYVNNDKIIGFYYNPIENKIYNEKNKKRLEVINKHKRKKIIATTNPSLDLPKVIDELEELAENHARGKWALYFDENFSHNTIGGRFIDAYKVGYSKAKETYSYTKDDMVEFADKVRVMVMNGYLGNDYIMTDEEMFDIWQEQRTKTILVK